MWETSEGDTKFLYPMTVVLLNGLGFWELKVSECRKFLMEASLFLVLGDASRLRGADCKEEEEEEASLSSSK